VLVADDSPTLRQALRLLLEEDPLIRVVAEAADGHEAVAEAQRTSPDVITMDVVMPGLDGLRATEAIMAAAPTRIIVVSQLASREQDLAFRALAAGAVELLPKPRVDGPDALRAWGLAVRRAVTLMSEVPVVTRHGQPGAARPPHRALEAIGVAASTGGPQAIVAILSRLPARLPLSILVAQHLASGFVDGMRRWFSESTALDVRLAVDGERPRRGCVYLAPPGCDLRLSRAGLLETSPSRGGVCPSCDTLLESLAECLAARAGGVVLSGMGEDGARGLLAIRRAGGLAIAQSAATAVVDGMPAAADALGAVEARLAPPDIAALLAAACPPGLA
jgi:two-component system chemotaxis response regulator CheB